jgi:hypothetical protein
MEKCIIKLVGVNGEEAASQIVNLNSNCELSNNFVLMSIVGIPDGILVRLLFVCKSGNFFHISLKKYGRYFSADISTYLEPGL